jgi:hypothetical protein
MVLRTRIRSVPANEYLLLRRVASVRDRARGSILAREDPMPTRALSAALLTCLAVVTGCASLANTDAQRVAEQRWRACQRKVAFVQIDSIDLDGRIRFRHVAPTDRVAMLQCLSDANQTAPRLPEPVAIQEPRGA